MNPGFGFEQDIKPLFLPFDREAMRFAFDLWLHQDVAENAALILERLERGDMPCDNPWPPERVALFRSWILEGHPA